MVANTRKRRRDTPNRLFLPELAGDHEPCWTASGLLAEASAQAGPPLAAARYDESEGTALARVPVGRAARRDGGRSGGVRFRESVLGLPGMLGGIEPFEDDDENEDDDDWRRFMGRMK
jgi:hypothetical protein